MASILSSVLLHSRRFPPFLRLEAETRAGESARKTTPQPLLTPASPLPCCLGEENARSRREKPSSPVHSSPPHRRSRHRRDPLRTLQRNRRLFLERGQTPSRARARTRRCAWRYNAAGRPRRFAPRSGAGPRFLVGAAGRVRLGLVLLDGRRAGRRGKREEEGCDDRCAADRRMDTITLASTSAGYVILNL